MPRARSSGALSIWSYAFELAAELLGADLRQRRRQRRLAVVDVTDRPHVHVRFRPIEFLLRHGCLRWCGPSRPVDEYVEPVSVP